MTELSPAATMTDYKRLCAELTEYLSLLDEPPHELVVRAQFALSEPELQELTDIEIASILKAYAVIEPQMGASRILHEKHFSNAAHAILALLGNHQGVLTSSMPQPIPIIKRRPRLEDCDAEGRCWWGAPAYPDLAPASWRFVSAKDRFSSELYWLPANALPLPNND